MATGIGPSGIRCTPIVCPGARHITVPVKSVIKVLMAVMEVSAVMELATTFVIKFTVSNYEAYSNNNDCKFVCYGHDSHCPTKSYTWSRRE